MKITPKTLQIFICSCNNACKFDNTSMWENKLLIRGSIHKGLVPERTQN